MTNDAQGSPEQGFATRQVHAGQRPDPATGARITPVYLSAGFVFDDLEHAKAGFAGAGNYTYTRVGNPTLTAVERKLADLEGGVDAIVVASGQAAVATALLGILRAGDHLVSARSIYSGSRSLFVEVFERFGITVDFVDEADGIEGWHRATTPATRAYFAESIANPRNEILDIAGVAAAAHSHGVPLVVDSTLATPYLVRPIEHGADVVVHSTSKFLTGNGSALGGVIVDGGRFPWADHSDLHPHLSRPGADGTSFLDRFGDRAYAQYTRDVIIQRLGPTLSPSNAFLVQQGLETLSLRIDRHSRTALAIAEWLESRPEVGRVDYAGLVSSAHHASARRYLPRGAGSVFAVQLHGGLEAARAVHDTLSVFSRMTHLGDVRSLVLHPATTTHSSFTAAERDALGIDDGVLRLSIGLEEPADLLADLERAFATIPREPAGAHPVGDDTSREQGELTGSFA
ncbi:MAG: PLP-dependent transferase [Naasia sp.]